MNSAVLWTLVNVLLVLGKTCIYDLFSVSFFRLCQFNGERDFTKYNMFLDQHPC